jgi:O-methyltransferase domain
VSETPARPPDREDLTRILGLILGTVRAKAVYVAAKLGLADELGDGLLTVAELARRTDANPDALYRVMRALAGEGLFHEVEPRMFTVTDAGRLLSEDAAGSRKYLSLICAEQLDRAFDHMLEVVRTGEPAARQTFGKPYFDWLADHPDAAEIFNKAMSGGASVRLPTLLALDVWSSAGSVVDVGGGSGTAVAALLKEHPHLLGTVFDLPHAEAAAKALLAAEGVAERATFEPGDFFESVPSGADVYVLLQILHDWSDEDATGILRSVRRATADDSRLIVLEDIVPEEAESGGPLLLDLQMLVILGGRERTEAEWRRLLAGGGFDVERITYGPRAAAIEALPALYE